MAGATVSQEEKTGVIEAYYAEDTGLIREDGTGTGREFYQQGASVNLQIGDAVIYLVVTLPTGKTITGSIRKPE